MNGQVYCPDVPTWASPYESAFGFQFGLSCNRQNSAEFPCGHYLVALLATIAVATAVTKTGEHRIRVINVFMYSVYTRGVTLSSLSERFI